MKHYLIVIAAAPLGLGACSTEQGHYPYTRLAPDAGIRVAAATIDGTMIQKSGCLGLQGSDGIFRPFILYGSPETNRSPGSASIRLGEQSVVEGETVTAVGQIMKIDDVRAVSEQVTPRRCGDEGVMIRRFVKNAD